MDQAWDNMTLLFCSEITMFVRSFATNLHGDWTKCMDLELVL
jgi:hypothetical protein